MYFNCHTNDYNFYTSRIFSVFMIWSHKNISWGFEKTPPMFFFLEFQEDCVNYWLLWCFYFEWTHLWRAQMFHPILAVNGLKLFAVWLCLHKYVLAWQQSTCRTSFRPTHHLDHSALLPQAALPILPAVQQALACPDWASPPSLPSGGITSPSP